MKPVRPKVSVVCVCYNQEQYITAALDGFVAQKGNFEYEVIVSDDGSNDSTRRILKEYAAKYSFIKPILRAKNLGPIPNLIDTLRQASGKYIALCEGDDYWTDVNKLEKQVDFLEAHPDYTVCFHPVRIVFERGEKADSIFPKATSSFTAQKLLEHNFIQTNSVMYRRQKYEGMPTDIMPGDWYLHLYHASFGKIGFINQVMSVYRRHPGGVWWNQHAKPQLIWKKYGYNYLRLLHEIMLLYGRDSENRKIIDNHIAGSYEAIASMRPYEDGDDVAIKAISNIPSETWSYIKRLMQQVEHYSKHDAYLQGVAEYEAQQKAHSEQIINQLSSELNLIKSSKIWKVTKVARLSRHPIKSAKRLMRYMHGRRSLK